jgi:hypothetical protein
LLFKKLQKYTAVLITILLTLSVIAYGCKNTSVHAAEEEGTSEEQSTLEDDSLTGIDSETKLKAFETAQVYIGQKYPGANFESGYDEDKVAIESSGIYKVTIDFSSEGSQYNWEILLEYDQQSDSFTVVDAPDFESGTAQEPQFEEQPEEQQESQQEEKPEEKPQESEGKKQLSPQEIKRGVWDTALEDALSNFTVSVYTTGYNESSIEDLWNNFYQCCIVFIHPGPIFAHLYLVRYDPAEIKWYIPFKTDYLNFQTRAANSVKHYIENQDNWVQNNCNGVIFDNNSVKVTEWKDSTGKTVIGKFKVDIKFQCQGKDGSLTWYDCSVNTRYDILSDSFVDFDMGCTSS